MRTLTAGTKEKLEVAQKAEAKGQAVAQNAEPKGVVKKPVVKPIPPVNEKWTITFSPDSVAPSGYIETEE